MTVMKWTAIVLMAAWCVLCAIGLVGAKDADDSVSYVAGFVGVVLGFLGGISSALVWPD